MTAAQPRIFFSHSSKDQDFCLQLVNDLQAVLGDESAVWYDARGGLHGGDTWWRKIMQELKARDVFIVVLSPDAVVSPWVNSEIDLAWRQKHSPSGKLIIPLLYRTCEVRDDLDILQIISFLPPKSYEVALEELLLALGLTPKKAKNQLDINIASLKTKEQWIDEGNALNNLERYEEALTAYEQGLRLDPNTNRPNFYILLDLDPDAPWDQEAFERVLSVKRSEWSRQANGVGQRALEARKYLELLPQIRVVMQNPMQRNAEEREARVQRDAARKIALEELELRMAKGYITQDEIDELTRDFSLLAREEITKRITVYIVNKPGQQPPNTIQPLAPELQQRIETHLEALGKKDLYELLGLSSSASRAELVTAADRLYNEMVRRPASSETTTKKNLAGHAKIIFSSGETRQSYDASLRLKSPKSLQDTLEVLARAVNSKSNKAVVAREIELYLYTTRKDGWEDSLALGWFLEEAHKQQWTIQSFPKKQTNETPITSQTSSTGYGRIPLTGGA